MTEPSREHAAIRLMPEQGRVRYPSGLTLHEEELVDGLWIGRYWQSAGFVEAEQLLDWLAPAVHNPRSVSGIGLAAFGLEIDGQSLHWGGELVQMAEQAPHHDGTRHTMVELRSTLRPVTVQVHTESDGAGFLARWFSITNEGALPATLGDVWS